jgi:hypothetical protein
MGYHKTRSSFDCTLHGQANIANILDVEGKVEVFKVGTHWVLLLFGPQTNGWSGPGKVA